MDGIKVNGNFYALSRHALSRANKRKITLEEIEEALTAPKKILRLAKKGKDDSLTFIGRNSVSVVVSLDHTTIITVLRRSKQYSQGRHKNRRNARQVKNKRLYGNRAKK